MTNRERAIAALNYEDYDHMPVIAFAYWVETLDKWAAEGHITKEEAQGYRSGRDNCEADKSIMKKLGFDYNWNSMSFASYDLFPWFDEVILEECADGSILKRDHNGLIVRVKPGIISIPSEVGTSLTGRKAWEELYLPRLQFSRDRIDFDRLKKLGELENDDLPRGLGVGSLMGRIRDLLGVEHLSYLYADDEDLYVEIINTCGNLCYDITKAILETGAKFDYAHFWEDICFKNGPLVAPGVFDELVGPHYKRVTGLLNGYGINIVSLDCDGCIDSLIPTWLHNGVNTMFPIEVGTWRASIAPWREKYGRELRGVGGMDKKVFAYDYKAVDEEIERLKPLVALGGYLPCPDHRIPPDAKFENVQYYCERFRKTFE